MSSSGSLFKDVRDAIASLSIAAATFEFEYAASRAKREANEALDKIERAYRQACTNLATIRPSDIEGATIGDDADRYFDALLAGWGGIQGWDDRER